MTDSPGAGAAGGRQRASARDVRAWVAAARRRRATSSTPAARPAPYAPSRKRGIGMSLYNSTFSRAVWRPYGGAKRLAMWYYLAEARDDRLLHDAPAVVVREHLAPAPAAVGRTRALSRGSRAAARIRTGEPTLWKVKCAGLSQSWASVQTLTGMLGRTAGPACELWASPVGF
jgi:hypothetical protein